MPKAILEFLLPEDKESYSTAIHGEDYKTILRQVDEWLRAKVKYGSPQEQLLSADEVRKAIWDRLSDLGLDLH